MKLNILYTCIVFFLTSLFPLYGQCSDTANYNVINNINKVNDFFVFPSEQDTIESSLNNVFIIPCNLPDGKWLVKYKGINKYYLTFKMKNNKMEGVYKYYYANGNVAGLINYKNNIRHGKSKFYYSDGVIKVKSIWEYGKMSGKWQYFNREGKIYHEKVYDSGKMILEKIYYNEIPEDILEWYRR